MASTDENVLDLAYLVAALVEEAGGELKVSQDWFTIEDSPFTGAQLKLTNENGFIVIKLEEI